MNRTHRFTVAMGVATFIFGLLLAIEAGWHRLAGRRLI
jgi:hypothetical protein